MQELSILEHCKAFGAKEWAQVIFMQICITGHSIADMSGDLPDLRIYRVGKTA